VASVAFDHMTKRFVDVIAFDNLNLQVEDKAFIVLLGPSCWGKCNHIALLPGRS